MDREEAIEIIRKNMPSDKSLPVYEALHTLIPELAESEDERIRNSLLEFLDDVWHMGKNANFDRWGKADCADWIAYLEKKKETGIRWFKSDEVKNPDKPYIDKAGMFYTTDGRMCLASEIEKQKEQKPNVLHDAFDKSKKDYTLEEKSKASDYAESILPTSVMYGESEEEYKLHTIIEAAFIAGQKEQKPAENISHLTVQGKGVYKICPRCKERMIRDDSKVYTSMPPQYGYECPKCGEIEFDTVMYDDPEMEDQKPVEKQDYFGLNDLERAIHRGFLSAGVENVPVGIIKETAKECLAQMKHTEWNGEDKTNGWTGVDLERYLSCLQRLGTGNPQQPETINSKWFKEHCQPQLKQEWSEEDEKHRQWILECLADRKRKVPEFAEQYQAAFDWLKSLRPQPKAKLTLLDENIIKAAVAFVEKNDHFNCWGGINKHTVIKALHSLKPSWKPSEEHFQGLRRAITKADKDSDAERDLKDLYEQPKKLGVKEEPEYYQHFDPDC